MPGPLHGMKLGNYTAAPLAYQWQRQKKTNCLPFSGFKSQRFLHESSHDGVSGTADNDEQLLNNSASVFHLWLLEVFS